MTFGRRRSPRAAWEAHLLIAIFSDGGDPRWCKVQVFSGGTRPGWWCLSAVEGMQQGEETILLGRSDRVEKQSHALGRDEYERDERSWRVRTPRMVWEGHFPDLELRASGLQVKTHTPDVVTWARLGDLLTYRSAIGTLDWNGRKGTALVEHARGAASPIALDRILPRRWQWDVLCFGEGRAAAALSIARVPVSGGGGIDPEGALRRARGLVIRDRRDDRWNGTLRLLGASVRYAAKRTTPVAGMFAGGGFAGFDFEGQWRTEDGAPVPVKGAGFTEFRRP